MLELLIGLVVTIAAGYLIVKATKRAGVLPTGGLVLLILTGIIGHTVLPKNVASTGNLLTDSLEYAKPCCKTEAAA